MGAFLRGMQALGYVEGKNLVIEWRFAEGRTELLPVLAEELVRLQVDVIVTSGAAAAIAAQKATATIPIVFPNTGDPIAYGFVKSLAQPGGREGVEPALLRLAKERAQALVVMPSPGAEPR